MEDNPQPGIGVTRELASFVKPVLSRGLEIIFFNVSLDRTGVESQVLSCDYAFLNETAHQGEPNGLEITVGLGSQELRKPFFGRSWLAREKTENLGHDRIILEFKDKVGQRMKPAKVLIDQGSQNRVLGKRRAPRRPRKIRKRGQVFKKLFETDSWREIFGLEKRNIFHGPLEFRDDRR
jgi:hypothetical protein